MSRWLDFVELRGEEGCKTKMWAVRSTSSGGHLGDVRWFGRWRCYGFFPAPDTVFNEGCLRDIASFCDTQTSNQRAAAWQRRLSGEPTP